MVIYLLWSFLRLRVFITTHVYTLEKNLEFYDIMYVNRTFLYLDI